MYGFYSFSHSLMPVQNGYIAVETYVDTKVCKSRQWYYSLICHRLVRREWPRIKARFLPRGVNRTQSPFSLRSFNESLLLHRLPTENFGWISSTFSHSLTSSLLQLSNWEMVCFTRFTVSMHCLAVQYHFHGSHLTFSLEVFPVFNIFYVVLVLLTSSFIKDLYVINIQ